jgi:hypothetical protein
MSTVALTANKVAGNVMPNTTMPTWGAFMTGAQWEGGGLAPGVVSPGMAMAKGDKGNVLSTYNPLKYGEEDGNKQFFNRDPQSNYDNYNAVRDLNNKRKEALLKDYAVNKANIKSRMVDGTFAKTGFKSYEVMNADRLDEIARKEHAGDINAGQMIGALPATKVYDVMNDLPVIKGTYNPSRNVVEEDKTISKYWGLSSENLTNYQAYGQHRDELEAAMGAMYKGDSSMSSTSMAEDRLNSMFGGSSITGVQDSTTKLGTYNPRRLPEIMNSLTSKYAAIRTSLQQYAHPGVAVPRSLGEPSSWSVANGVADDPLNPKWSKESSHTFNQTVNVTVQNTYEQLLDIQSQIASIKRMIGA